MSISQRLDLRQTQTLVMTPQLQQAIKLLQMSGQELSDYVDSEIEQNPLLERGNNDGEAFEQEDSAAPAEKTDSAAEALNGDLEALPQTGGDSDWPEDDKAFGGDHFHESHNNSFHDHDDFEAINAVAEKPSLREHLMEQIQVDITQPGERMIAVALIEMLDDAGYLPIDLELMRTQLGATGDQFEAVIGKLQHFDPPGIFARSLKECLSIQLRERNRLDPAMQILLNHLDLVARREKQALMRLCLVDAEDLADMIDEIRNLNPKPAMIFVSDVAAPIVPDVFIRPQAGGGWHIELNTDTLPRVLANERYYTRIQGSAHSKSDKEYISNRWQQANWLVKALQQRATTILKVASEIVRQQDQFFVHGVQHLRPLILRDIAQAVEMHESTISRVTQNKYIATPRGMFELKYFFTTALTRTDGGETVSSEAARERIRQLVESEDQKAILSDDRLADMLKTEGIDIARRTVAKYREAMGIPTSALRRRHKRI